MGSQQEQNGGKWAQSGQRQHHSKSGAGRTKLPWEAVKAPPLLPPAAVRQSGVPFSCCCCCRRCRALVRLQLWLSMILVMHYHLSR